MVGAGVLRYVAIIVDNRIIVRLTLSISINLGDSDTILLMLVLVHALTVTGFSTKEFLSKSVFLK